MSPIYAPSLVPIVGLCAVLAGLVVWRDRSRWPIALAALSLAAWAVAALLAATPETAVVGGRMLMVGFFIPASLLHVAALELNRRTMWVHATYALGALMTAGSLTGHEVFLSAGGTAPGRLFAPMFVLTIAAGAVPMGWLWASEPPAGRAEHRRYLLLATAASTGGAALHIGAQLAGSPTPIGMYLVFSAIGLLTYVALAADLPTFGRFVERSQRYTLLAAVLSTVWTLLLVTAVSGSSAWTWESAALLFVLVLTAQPLLTEARSQLTGVVFPGQTDAEGLTRALAQSEAKAEHSRRLAELGMLTAAVAHEVRNPLGVIAACATTLERGGADPALLSEIRGAVTRASTFADDLLAYGRPAPLVTRPLALEDAAQLAAGESSRAHSGRCVVTVEGQATLEADLKQVVQLLVLLLDNAMAAGAEQVHIAVRAQPGGASIEVQDDGPGVPPELRERLFDAFVTGRGRGHAHPGTGLGLAIACGIAERHRGSLTLNEGGALGGAHFTLLLSEHPGTP
jgi:signal transduction histidine kinase